MVTRIISGLLLGFLFLLLCMQSTPWVLLAFGVPHLVAQIEFTSLLPELSKLTKTLWVIGNVAVWGAACWVLINGHPAGIVIVAAAFLALGISMADIIKYERADNTRHRQPTITMFGFSAFSIALPFALMSALAVKSADFPYLLLLIGAGWAADTAGVFSGKYLGRSVLVKHLSPKKTREGAVGGILAGGIVWLALLGIYGTATLGDFFGNLQYPLPEIVFCGLGMIVAAAGICGDLSLSMHKRLAGVKDYGSIIPGHGGVLDRFDAMISAAPLVYLVLLLR